MARLTRKETQQNTRERLLSAAAKVVARRGIKAASIREIAETAGYSLGALYSNYANKEALLQELLAVYMRAEISALKEIIEVAQGDSLEETLNSISSWIKKLQGNQSTSSLSVEFQAYANRNDSFRKIHNIEKNKRQEEFAACLKVLFANQGLVPRLEISKMAFGFISMWFGFVIQGEPPWSDAAHEVFIVFLRALLNNAVPLKKPAGKTRKESL